MKRETLSELGLSKEQIDSVLGEYGKSVTDLKERLSAAEEERDQLQTNYDNQHEKLETTFAEQQKDFAIKYTMKNVDVHDSDIVMNLLDKSKIAITDGELRGLGEQLEGMKESKPFLFKEQEEQHQPTPQIVVGGNSRSNEFAEKDAFSSITDKYK